MSTVSDNGNKGLPVVVNLDDQNAEAERLLEQHEEFLRSNAEKWRHEEHALQAEQMHIDDQVGSLDC